MRWYFENDRRFFFSVIILLLLVMHENIALDRTTCERESRALNCSFIEKKKKKQPTNERKIDVESVVTEMLSITQRSRATHAWTSMNEQNGNEEEKQERKKHETLDSLWCEPFQLESKKVKYLNKRLFTRQTSFSVRKIKKRNEIYAIIYSFRNRSDWCISLSHSDSNFCFV